MRRRSGRKANGSNESPIVTADDSQAPSQNNLGVLTHSDASAIPVSEKKKTKHEATEVSRDLPECEISSVNCPDDNDCYDLRKGEISGHSVNTSSRPVRIRKKRNFDDFHMFDSSSAKRSIFRVNASEPLSLSRTEEQEEHFSTSTPIPGHVKTGNKRSQNALISSDSGETVASMVLTKVEPEDEVLSEMNELGSRNISNSDVNCRTQLRGNKNGDPQNTTYLVTTPENEISDRVRRKRGRPKKETKICDDSSKNSNDRLLADDGDMNNRKRRKVVSLEGINRESGNDVTSRMTKKDAKNRRSTRSVESDQRQVEGDESSGQAEHAILKKSSRSSKKGRVRGEVIFDEDEAESTSSQNERQNVSTETKSSRSGQSKTQANAPSPEGSNKKSGGAVVCQRCEKTMRNLNVLRGHMMTDHSLIWTAGNPLGDDKPQMVIKRLGHIDCQKCQKRFRFPQYYKHHQIWCGREDEIAVCDICNRRMRAMWLHQHKVAHKTREKQMVLEEEKEQRLLQGNELKKEVDEEDKGEGEASGSAGKRLRRQAAKSAIKMMNAVQDPADLEDEPYVSSDDNFEVKEEETDDDDDDNDDVLEVSDEDVVNVSDEEEDETDVVEVQRRPKKRIHDAPASARLETVGDASDWELACDQGAGLNPAQRLMGLQEFLNNQSGAQVFVNCCPSRTDWEPLISSERNKYMQSEESSTQLTARQTKTADDADGTSLKWGNTCRLNGRHYCFAGGPIWSVEWCPLPEGAAHVQILAVSADRFTVELPEKNLAQGGPGLIQIWSLGRLLNSVGSNAEPVLQYCIAHDSGHVNSMSWCPRCCFDEGEIRHSKDSLRRLGLLAAACPDGSVLVYSIPQLSELKQSRNTIQEGVVPVYRPQPALKLVSNSTAGSGPCLCVSWQQSGDLKYIVAGFGKGTVYVWDLSSSSPLIWVDSTTLRPLRCFKYHSMAVVSCAWNPRNPSVFVTSSLDCSVCLWNVERSSEPISILKRTRFMQLSRSLCWAGPMHPGFFSTTEKSLGSDHCPVSFHGLSKTALVQTGMAATVQVHTSCTWDVTFCPFYEILVTCDAVGKVMVTLMPMKMVRTVKGKSGWYKSRCLYTELYHAKVHRKGRLPSPAKSPAHEAESMKSAADTMGSANKMTNREDVLINSANLMTSNVERTDITISNSGADTTPHGQEVSCQSDQQCWLTFTLNGENVVKKAGIQIYDSDSEVYGDRLTEDGEFVDTRLVGELRNFLENRPSGESQTSMRVDIATAGKSNHSAKKAPRTMSPEKTSQATSPKKTLKAVSPKKTSKAVKKTSVASSSDESLKASDSLTSCSSVKSVTTTTVIGPNITVIDRIPVPRDAQVNNVATSTSVADSTDLDSVHLNESPFASRSSPSKSTSQLSEHPPEVSEEEKVEAEEENIENVLHFQDCKMEKGELKAIRSQPKRKPELEAFGENPINAIRRVRLNPNPSACLWLASGGQAGLLRLDNLSGLIQPNSLPVYRFLQQRNTRNS